MIYLGSSLANVCNSILGNVKLRVEFKFKKFLPVVSGARIEIEGEALDDCFYARLLLKLDSLFLFNDSWIDWNISLKLLYMRSSVPLSRPSARCSPFHESTIDFFNAL